MPETRTPVRTPTKPAETPAPDRHFNPDRLCPAQKKDAGDGGRPL